MVQIYNGMLRSHRKEHVWVSCSEVDEPRASYTEWSNSEGENQILYINMYILNLGKCTDESIFRAGIETQT